MAISYAVDLKSPQKLSQESKQHFSYVDTLRVKEGEGGGGTFYGKCGHQNRVEMHTG